MVRAEHTVEAGEATEARFRSLNVGRRTVQAAGDFLTKGGEDLNDGGVEVRLALPHPPPLLLLVHALRLSPPLGPCAPYQSRRGCAGGAREREHTCGAVESRPTARVSFPGEVGLVC
jgi:hypothetical protein